MLKETFKAEVQLNGWIFTCHVRDPGSDPQHRKTETKGRGQREGRKIGEGQADRQTEMNI